MSRKNEKKKDSEPGIGTVVATGAAVLAGAAIVYGAKKLFDLWNTSQESTGRGATASASPVETSACAKSCDDSDDEYHHSSNRQHPDRVTQRGRYPNAATAPCASSNESSSEPSAELYGARPKTRALPMTRGVSTMSEQLSEYYQQYVKIDASRMKIAADVVKEMKLLLSSQLAVCVSEAVRQQLSKTIKLKEIGSAVDGTQVINPDEFDILVAFELTENDWTVESTDVPGRLLVTRNKTEPGTFSEDVCDEDGRLLASEVASCLYIGLQCMVTSISSKNYGLSTSRKGSVICLGVTYSGDGLESVLFINLSPAVSIAGRCLVPTTVPSPTTQQTAADNSRFWRPSNFDAETTAMNYYGPTVTAHRELLMIFKSIRLNFPQQFGLLSSYHYKTVLLQSLDDQSDASEWSNSTLSERFIDFLVELASCCKEGLMPDFTEERANLLADVGVEARQGLAAFINRMLGQHDFGRLLEERIYSKN